MVPQRGARVVALGLSSSSPSSAPVRARPRPRRPRRRSRPPGRPSHREPVRVAEPPSAAPSVVAARWEPAGGLTFEWTDPHAVVLGDGRVLLVGAAAEDGTPRASVRDSASAGWKAVDPLPKARSGFAMVTLGDGRALVVGGLNDQGQSYSSSYAFDPTTEAWSKTAVMAAARTRPPRPSCRRARADRRRLLPAVQRRAVGHRSSCLRPTIAAREWPVDPGRSWGTSTFRISAMPSRPPRCTTRPRTPSARPGR